MTSGTDVRAIDLLAEAHEFQYHRDRHDNTLRQALSNRTLVASYGVETHHRLARWMSDTNIVNGIRGWRISVSTVHSEDREELRVVVTQNNTEDTSIALTGSILDVTDAPDWNALKLPNDASNDDEVVDRWHDMIEFLVSEANVVLAAVLRNETSVL